VDVDHWPADLVQAVTRAMMPGPSTQDITSLPVSGPGPLSLAAAGASCSVRTVIRPQAERWFTAGERISKLLPGCTASHLGLLGAGSLTAN